MRTGIASAVTRGGQATVQWSVLVLIALLLLVACGGTGGDSQVQPQGSPEQLGQAFTMAIYEGEFDQAASYIVPAFRSSAQASFASMQTVLQQSGFQRVESVVATDYDVGMKKVTIKGGTWTGQLLITQQGSAWYVQDIQGWDLNPGTTPTQEAANTPLPPAPQPTAAPSPKPAATIGTAAAVAVQGEYAYVGEGFTLAVVEVRDPAHPVVVSQTAWLPGEVKDVAVTDTWACLADGTGGLRILDIADPAVPVAVGSYETNGYVFQVTPMGKYAYIADDNGLVMMDLADPAAPKKLDRYSPGSSTCARAAAGVVVGDHAYVVYRNTLAILDLTSAPPSIIGEYRHGSSAAPICMHGIAVLGNYVYATTDKGGILILDVGDPTRPQELARYELKDPDSGPIPFSAEAIAIAGQHAYVSFRTAIRVLDLADPTAPVEVGTYQVPQSDGVFAVQALDIAISGNYAYLACGEAGLIILDITNPAAPVEVKP